MSETYYIHVGNDTIEFDSTITFATTIDDDAVIHSGDTATYMAGPCSTCGAEMGWQSWFKAGRWYCSPMCLNEAGYENNHRAD